MSERLTSVFEEQGEDGAFTILQVAVCALLIKAASADDDFQPEERAMIQGQLSQRFAMESEKASALIDSALEFLGGSNGLYACSMVLNDELDDSERESLLAMVWEIMYADGFLHQYEERLMRRVGPILDIEEEDSLRIRDEVRSRMEVSPE
ncbi:TerB family tellurite resistance protein [Magnetospira sp. QH-2]|uniref:tellurite resistance TerB family protein n=1 Tax=Magnetospira sp. (strain QH-2) TaxID=1288970 RepID=UPI00130ED08D|nr:TerB family tellurite resistance protein [Magnetospira sp. QH-2]